MRMYMCSLFIMRACPHFHHRQLLVFKSFKMMEAHDLCGHVVKYVPRMNGEEASSLVKQGRAA